MNRNNLSSNENDLDLYDIEFIGLLHEIDLRMDNFSHGEQLKIKSWVKNLMFPTNIIKQKKNRNLYAIKLINNMINERIEEPFTKFCKSPHDLIWLSVEIIKSELSKKFYEEIKIEDVENYGYKKNKENIENENRLPETPLELEKFKLNSIINNLIEMNNQKDKIIQENEYELNELKKNIISLEKKTKIIKGHQLNSRIKNAEKGLK
jgi:hypothetical protein